MYTISVRKKEKEVGNKNPIFKQWGLNSWSGLGDFPSRDKYEEIYNLKMIYDSSGNVDSLTFNSEEEAVMFILKWS